MPAPKKPSPYPLIRRLDELEERLQRIEAHLELPPVESPEPESLPESAPELAAQATPTPPVPVAPALPGQTPPAESTPAPIVSPTPPAAPASPPVNAAFHRLVFEARGESGGEQIELIFKDALNNSSLNAQRIIPFESGLSTHWQLAEIRLEDSAAFQAQQVTQMRIEFGTQRTDNPPDSSLFIKNIQWIPRDTGENAAAN